MTPERLDVSSYPVYKGPLGVHFDCSDLHKGADFYLWAPTATKVSLVLAETTNSCDPAASHREQATNRVQTNRVPMNRGHDGEWHVRVDSDVWGFAYWYELTFEPPYSTYIKDTNNGVLPAWARPLTREKEENETECKDLAQSATAQSCVITAVDPYARAVTANGERGVAIDPERILNPRTWLTRQVSEQEGTYDEPCEQTTREVGVVKRGEEGTKPQTPVIYEMHVRDMTIAPDNGIAHKGQFLGLTESGTRTAKGNKSGLDYVADLGVSHVQLLPVYDFGSVDELGDLTFGAQYNWGYDPVNYNAPEGSYSSNPSNPEARVRELRALIDAFHARGIGVVMDVVYNHVYKVREHSFERTVPGYFFRMSANDTPGTQDNTATGVATGVTRGVATGVTSGVTRGIASGVTRGVASGATPTVASKVIPTFLDGSFCGNETASERPMMRRYIVDSMTYWARVYGFDGFRVDLMGLHDVDTMLAVRRALDSVCDAPCRQATDGVERAVDKRILLLGEGWEMGNHPPGVTSATQAHGALMPGIAMFNDTFRDTMKGSVFCPADRGFISGVQGVELELYDALLGAPNTRDYVDASQSVVYNEAHDNQTVFDKLVAGGVSAPAKRALFALQVQLLAHGTHFIHAGQEFCRTKHGDENSYRSPDSVNAFDYDRADEFRDAVDSVRELIAFRRSQPWLNEVSYSAILDSHELLFADDLRLVYRVRGAFGGMASAGAGGSAGSGGVSGVIGGVASAGSGGARDAIVVINGSDRPWQACELRGSIGAIAAVDAGTDCAGNLAWSARVYDGRVIKNMVSLAKTDGASMSSSKVSRKMRNGSDAMRGVPGLSVSVFELRNEKQSGGITR